MKNSFLNSIDTKNRYVESINNTEIVKRDKLKRLFMNHNLIDGAFFEITGNVEGNFNVFFHDKKTNKIIHQSNLSCNMWTKTNRKYYTDWHVYLTDEKGEKIYETDLTLKNRRVYIAFDSSSIGDNIAWIPYVEEFRKQHNCEVIVSTFWNHLFEDVYTNLEFVKPGTVVSNIYAMYKIGCFYNPDLEPELCNTIPLQKVPCNILGLDYKEIKPNIDFINNKDWSTTLTDKYVLIAPHSTAGLKYWNNPTGWQEVVDYLKSEGYRVFNVSREGCDFVGVESISDYSMENIMKYIAGCEFFIGLSSGLSWLAWSMNKHVFLISNFTNKEHEFNTNCTRIVNESVCNSCWVKPEHKFDKGDWNWCPLHKDTERQFECSKSITGGYVIQKIKDYIGKNFDWGNSDKSLIDELTNEIFRDKIYERIFEVKEDDVVVDIGASIGPFTQSILHKNPKLVYCLEPSNSQFKTLQNNFKGKQVICINKGITKTDGVFISEYIFGDENQRTMSGISFKSFISDNKIEKINFLKIDCEGGEYDIFTEENINFLKNNVEFISAEIHLRSPELKEKFKDFRDGILKNFDNYKIYTLDGVDVTHLTTQDSFIPFYKEIMLYIQNK